MKIERNDNMVDFLHRPLYEGDLVMVTSGYSGDIQFAIIKHFSECGFYGPHFWMWNRTGLSELEEYFKEAAHRKIHCSSSYSISSWKSKYGLRKRILKQNPEEILSEVAFECYNKILTRLEINNDEPTGSFCL